MIYLYVNNGSTCIFLTEIIKIIDSKKKLKIITQLSIFFKGWVMNI